ncbi:MAG: hypothetical protein ACI9XC_000098 [Gammaproteobacteria bacterium]|jgi:hypothetical protein
MINHQIFPFRITDRCCIFIKLNSMLLLAIFIFILSSPTVSFAQWAVAADTKTPNDEPRQVAYTTNSEGYTLEIYMDSNMMIRSRFILKEGMLKLEEKSCPTYQIDNGMANNNSINGDTCLSNHQWAEFIFGNIQNGTINSSILLAFMDGITLTFRFRLENGDYRETKFSLSGSKRSMTSIIGDNVIVRTQL